MNRIAIIARSSYLAQNIEEAFGNLPVMRFSHENWESHVDALRSADCVINFALQPEFSRQALVPSDVVDIRIAEAIASSQTRMIFLSSRTVYGSSATCRTLKESDAVAPMNHYAANKVMAEKELLHRMGERLTILRPGNVMGPPVYTGQNSTFIAWVSKSMENAGRVHLNVDRGTVKDFITRDYFQQVLAAFARKPEPGVWNVGAGFGVSLAHLLDCMVGEERYDDTPSVAPSDQFILDVSKLRIAMGLSITPAQLDAQCERNRIAFDAAQVAPLSVAKSEAVA